MPINFSLLDAWDELHLVRPSAPKLGKQVVSAGDEYPWGNEEGSAVGEGHELVVFVVPFGTNNTDAVADEADIGLSLLSFFSLLLQAGRHARFFVWVIRDIKRVRWIWLSFCYGVRLHLINKSIWIRKIFYGQPSSQNSLAKRKRNKEGLENDQKNELFSSSFGSLFSNQFSYFFVATQELDLIYYTLVSDQIIYQKMMCF